MQVQNYGDSFRKLGLTYVEKTYLPQPNQPCDLSPTQIAMQKEADYSLCTQAITVDNIYKMGKKIHLV